VSTPYREEIIGNQKLVLGDSREVVAELLGKYVTVTDPPYAVKLGSRLNNGRQREAYDTVDDDATLLRDVVLPIVGMCRELGRTVVFSGTKSMFKYPEPDHVICIHQPAGTGCNPWGFTCWQPLLCYGTDPFAGTGSRPDAITNTEQSEKNGHPCPKPIGLMKKVISRCALSTETILDPFMGSGTTLVASELLGMSAVGIEVSQAYFDIACREVEKATRQPKLCFDAPQPQTISMGL
jgi:hypothetical protein